MPLTAILEDFAFGELCDIARQRYQSMASCGFGCELPLMAFEVLPPVTDFSLNPPIVFRVSESPERMTLLGLEQSWGARLMEVVAQIGRALDSSGAPPPAERAKSRSPKLFVPQRKSKLAQVYADMRESGTTVLACSFPTGKKRVPFLCVVILDGTEVVADLRQRMNLGHRKTLTFLCPSTLSLSP